MKLIHDKLLPEEIVEILLQRGPRELDHFGSLFLILKTPEEPHATYLSDLVDSVLRDSAPLSQAYANLVTAEMPTLRVPTVDVSDADQVELLAELDGSSHCIVPLRPDGPTRTMTLGRGSQSDIYVSDPSVSGDHAELIINDGGVRIVDRGSKNGTQLNGQTLVKQHATWLQPMDRLTFGRVAGFACAPRTLRAVLRAQLRIVV